MPMRKYPGLDDPIRPIILEPGPTAELAERYEFVDVSAMGDLPLFRVVHAPPDPRQTAEQYRTERKDKERYYYSLSVMRCLAHQAADALGFPARCKRRVCRRERACMGERHEFDWSFPGPWMPPCASTVRLVDVIRAHIRETTKDWNDDEPEGPAA